MSFPLRFAVLIDGAFLIRKLQAQRQCFPSAADIASVADTVSADECVQLSRLRVYFYHAQPAVDELMNPLSKTPLRLRNTEVFSHHRRLLDSLVDLPDFALRLGETAVHGWKVGASSFKNLTRAPRALDARDLVPNIEQKGVDLRVGLDIARLSLRQSVQAIVVLTGDSDLVPALKFARREGLRVFLCHLNHPIRPALREHADRIIEVPAFRPESLCAPPRAA